MTLKNGDRITGTLVTIKGGTLQLKSDILGDLSIPMAKVATYSVDKPVAVIVKGKEPVQGTLALTPSGDWQVKANGQTQTIAAASVDTIMPADTYQKLVVVRPTALASVEGQCQPGRKHPARQSADQHLHDHHQRGARAPGSAHLPGTHAHQLWLDDAPLPRQSR